ncbi:hypothetical protein KI387_032187, partial [Taxus chinensis]
FTNNRSVDPCHAGGSRERSLQPKGFELSFFEEVGAIVLGSFFKLYFLWVQ